MNKPESSTTMIIPSGTEIQIDVHGQLSVRTSGNLVIQNSGHYGEIESISGSIRVEANAEVEAVSVRAAETGYVQGSLTSWKVKAKSIHLEKKAQARIVLQETESIEIGKNAHLVGNFSSDKELFLLFSRFAQQLKSLPFYFDRKQGPPQLEIGRVEEELPPEEPAPPREAPGAARIDVSPLSSRVLEAGKELADNLFFALVLLERESKNEAYGTTSVRVIEELVKLLKERDLDTLQHTFRTLFGRINTFRTLFGRIMEPGEDIRRAQELIKSHFGEPATEAPTASAEA